MITNNSVSESLQNSHIKDSQTRKEWLSQAPANTMLIGEHSVVYGHPALACAVNQWVRIHWQLRSDKAINIDSVLGSHHTQIDQITLHPKLSFVIAALQAFQTPLTAMGRGLDIKIESEFSSTIGLGSSAAVLAAMLSGLNSITQTEHDALTLFKMGHKIILDIQGRGSGTDLAASLYGGVIYYQPQNQTNATPKIEKVPIELPLTLLYSGYKTPTAEVLAMVAEQWQHKPKELEMLYRAMAQVTKKAYLALQQKDLSSFYQECQSFQDLMVQLGVSDKTLDKIISAVKTCKTVMAAKISGSGLGDCVITFGHPEQCSESIDALLQIYPRIDITIAIQGAHTQKV